jgi:alkanesulfonate monooxygenase SsuD/methylene tetrahydromethanopterin reductase-like flavin-dependent oxidoreductase (luciferase family)
VTVIDLQVSAAVLGWPEIREIAQAAEAAGFGAFHVFDHLAGLPLEGSSMIESFSLLGALAVSTTSIELGAMVMNVWNRQAGILVTGAASIAHLSKRRFHFGIGAGTSPTSRWAAEQHAAGQYVEPDVETRHRRVEQVLELASTTWSSERPEALSTFPLPSPVPYTILGVNSLSLARIAGRLADGINVPWNHPRRSEILAAADIEVGDRPFLRTAYHVFDSALFDPEHPERIAMTEHRIDRLVLAELGSTPRLPVAV